MDTTRWYGDWQTDYHADYFDWRGALNNRNLARSYESLNDVRLLNERLDRTREFSLLEVGCATGEFYRYLRLKYPKAKYYGIDISRPAIKRANEKYPSGKFFVNKPGSKISDTLKEMRITANPEIVYAKDVVQHQTRPFEFFLELVDIASEMLVVRCRTRDVGQTEADPERSCQYHYGGWMPYIVINLQELIEHITREETVCEVVVYRNHMVLGGQYNRFLPKDCYVAATGTAETAVGVFKKTDFPSRVTIIDQREKDPNYTFGYKIKFSLHKALTFFLPKP